MSETILPQRLEGYPRIAEYFQIPNTSPLRSVDTEIRREWRQYTYGRPQEWVLSHRTAGYTPAGSCLRLQENDVYRVTCFDASEGVTRGQAFLTLEKAEEYLATRGELLGDALQKGPEMTTYKCPECGSRDLDVTVQCWARLIQTGADNDYVFETDLDDSDQEWDSESAMSCRDCRHGGKVNDFTVEEEEPANAD